MKNKRQVEEAVQILLLSLLTIVAVGSAGAIVLILADMFKVLQRQEISQRDVLKLEKFVLKLEKLYIGQRNCIQVSVSIKFFLLPEQLYIWRSRRQQLVQHFSLTRGPLRGAPRLGKSRRVHSNYITVPLSRSLRNAGSYGLVLKGVLPRPSGLILPLQLL